MISKSLTSKLNSQYKAFSALNLVSEHYTDPSVTRFSKPIANLVEELVTISQKANSIYFGQGFPDWDTPTFVKMAMIEAVQNEENQYVRVAGHPALCEEIGKKYSKIFHRTINPMTQVNVGSGANSILSNALGAFLQPGEHEIVCFAPAFQGYIPMFHIMGAKKIHWIHTKYEYDGTISFNRQEFEAAFNSKTRFLVINNPMNPTGKVFNKEELNFFRSVMMKHPNVIALCDDVYEHQTYDHHVMHRFANLPDMWDRTINVFSAGKTFSITGWRVGYGIGPEHLIKPMNSFETWVNYCGSRPAQAAVAKCMKQAKQSYKNQEDFYAWINQTFSEKRERICSIIQQADIGLDVYEPEGGFFMVASIKEGIRRMPIKYFYKDLQGPIGYLEHFDEWKTLKNTFYTPDMAFCLYLTEKYGFTPCPMFPFYDFKDDIKIQDIPGTHEVRFSLCKRNTNIDLLENTIDIAKNRSRKISSGF